MRNTDQTPVFLQVYIIPEKIQALTELLNTGGNPQLKQSFFALDSINTVHFARWMIAPATDTLKASVIYSANVDVIVSEHLDDICQQLTTDLDAILSHCEDYPTEENRTNTSRKAFLTAHSFSSPAFYVGAPKRSVVQIKAEKALHEEVLGFVKKNRNQWKTALEAGNAIRKHLKSDKKWDELRKSSLPKKRGGIMLLLIALVVVLLPLLLLTVLFIFLFYELREKPFGKTMNDINPTHLKALRNQEDIISQNQISQVFETKGGLRKLFLHFILWATNVAAKNWFVEGQLMGTPTIHFARWVLIDGGKRFVFFSNFDGSYDEYLGDFVDNNGWGLNAIYGAAKGYPSTRFIFGRGSYRILEFMGWGRQTQVPTPLFYSAYPWQSLQQIVRVSKLRDELFKEQALTETTSQSLLSKI